MTGSETESADETRAARDSADGPVISVIVPTYNRPESLAACIGALAAQTLAPGRFEVIVADDGCSLPVATRQADLLAQLHGKVQLHVARQGNAGPAVARNLGAARARGRYLAFTDDDCVPAPDWLERLLARFETGPNLLLGGSMRNGLETNVYAAATHAIMDFVYAEYWRYSRARLFSTSNLSLPASAFRAMGGFSPEFPDAAGEDYDLCWRWQESGGQAEYAPEAMIVHCHPLTLRNFLRQHFAYGRGLLRVRRRQRARQKRKRAPGPGFYARLVLHPLRRWYDLAAWRCAALIGASQLATATGAAIEWLRPSQRRLAVPAISPRSES